MGGLDQIWGRKKPKPPIFCTYKLTDIHIFYKTKITILQNEVYTDNVLSQEFYKQEEQLHA